MTAPLLSKPGNERESLSQAPDHAQATSELDAYERAVLARPATDAERQALICEGRQAYFSAVRKVGEGYAEALLEQMTCALIHEAKAAA